MVSNEQKTDLDIQITDAAEACAKAFDLNPATVERTIRAEIATQARKGYTKVAVGFDGESCQIFTAD